MVKSHSVVSSYCVLDLRPFSIPYFMSQTQKQNICFSAKVLRLLNWVDNHFIEGSFERSYFGLNEERSSLFEVVEWITFFKHLFDFFAIIQGWYFFEENSLICLNLVSSLRAYVLRNKLTLFPRVHFEGLQKLLEISSVPIQKSKRHQSLLLNFFFFGKVHWLDSLEITAVLGIDFSLNQLFQSVWLGEKPEILHLIQFFLFPFFADADVSSLENLWT